MICAGFLASLGFGVRGESYSNFLASTVRSVDDIILHDLSYGSIVHIW